MQICFPIIVQVDYVGAIFKAENNTATVRARHVDAYYHFVHDYITEG